MKGAGVTIYGGMSKTEGKLTLVLQFSNKSSSPVDVINMQFNNNTFGLTPLVSNKLESPVPPGGNGVLSIPVGYSVDKANRTVPPSLDFNAAVQNASNGVVSYFNLSFPYHVMYSPDGKVC
jgi:hypothetical protein